MSKKTTYTRILGSTRGTDTRYEVSQDHEWTSDEISAVYVLPDKSAGAGPGQALTLAEFVVQPDFMGKHPTFPLPHERVKLAPTKIHFESSHVCEEGTTLTESHFEVQEVAGREGERIHFHATLKRKA